MADTNAIYNAKYVGAAKGRPGGYAAIVDNDFDVKQLLDVKKTIKDLISANPTKIKSLGYISEDGVEFSVDLSSDDKNDWAGDVVSSSISKYSESAKVTFLESSEAVLKTIYGDNNVKTEVDGSITVRHNARFTAPRIFIFDAVINETTVKRSIIPVGRIYERDSVKQNSSDFLGYTPTIKCMPAEVFDGDTYRDIFYDTTKAAVAPAASTPSASVSH